jgi:VWFA-related protein
VKAVRIAVLLVVAALPLAAQLTVNVRVIEVPVTVTDKAGNPVRGLQASNFEVLDDGKPQKVTAFESIDFASKQSVTAISPLNPNARRSFLLLFDLGYSNVKAVQRAREAARRFVEKNVQPRDLVAVGSVDPDKGYRLLTSFTTDRTLVEAAITEPQKYRSADPLQLSDLDAYGAQTAGQSTVGGVMEPGTTGTSGRGAAADAHAAEIKELSARNNRDFAIGRVSKQISSLGLLAATLRSVPGRKQVVFLSGGFDPSLVRGRTARGAMSSEIADMAKATSGQAYLIDNDARFGNTASLNIVDEMVKLFKQSDVVLNAIDLGGLRVDGDVQGVNVSSNDGLHMLADPTGGSVLENSNDFGSNLDRMMRQQEVVYVLAFQAAPTKPGKLHNLSVKLVNVPAGATAKSRVGYYEGGTETPVERALTNAEVIVNDIVQNDIKVAALATAVPAAKRAVVPLFLEINGEDLLRGATKPVPADIFVYAFDEGGVVRDRIYQQINVDPAKASDKIKQNGIRYFATLSLPPGRYAVKSLVSLPGTEKRGFVRAELVVPPPTEMVVLPPLFIDKTAQWAMVKGVQHDSGAAYPFHLDGEPFVPSVMPRLRAAEEGEFALFLYNANPEEMMMQATVTDAKGVTRPAAPSLVRQIRGEGVTKLVFHYGPNGVAPGPATLDLLIHKKGSPDVRKSTLPFVVAN